jgi:hypothetical protein
MTTARLALIAVLVIGAGSPVFAKETHDRSATVAAHSHQQGSALAEMTRRAPAARTQAVYDYDGRYLGSDPDPFIRLQLLRDNPYTRGGN